MSLQFCTKVCSVPCLNSRGSCSMFAPRINQFLKASSKNTLLITSLKSYPNQASNQLGKGYPTETPKKRLVEWGVWNNDLVDLQMKMPWQESWIGWIRNCVILIISTCMENQLTFKLKAFSNQKDLCTCYQVLNRKAIQIKRQITCANAYSAGAQKRIYIVVMNNEWTESEWREITWDCDYETGNDCSWKWNWASKLKRNWKN